MADNSALVQWLNHRIATITTAVPVAIYEGLRARIERGDFDHPHGAEPPTRHAPSAMSAVTTSPTTTCTNRSDASGTSTPHRPGPTVATPKRQRPAESPTVSR